MKTMKMDMFEVDDYKITITEDFVIITFATDEMRIYERLKASEKRTLKDWQRFYIGNEEDKDPETDLSEITVLQF